MSLPARKLFIKTYGCQMNFYDSDQMAELLKPLGYETIDTVEEADVAILNTCHIREKAEQKMYSDLGRLHGTKKKRQEQNKDLLIAVTGCTGQAQGQEIIKQAPYVSLVLGPQTYHRLPEYIARLHRAENKLFDTDFPSESKFDHLPAPKAKGGSAFVSIQEGCDKFCHFCVVPYTRGAEYSRPVNDVIKEIQTLVSQGAFEITLLGQNVNAYHGIGSDGTEWTLGKLLFAIAPIPGLLRIRYMTSHPLDMHNELLEAHRDLPNIMPFIHLPIQSGSNTILKAMNRKHTVAEYESMIDAYKEVCPHVAFSSDFIVGYPGETEEDHQDTLKLIDKIQYIQAYSFCYSPRPGTPASVLPTQIDSEIQNRRLQELQAQIQIHQISFNQSCVGQSMPVVFDRVGRKEGQIVGKSPYLQSVVIEGDLEKDKNKIIQVKIIHAGPNSLMGERLD